MSKIDDLISVLPRLTAGEKAALLQHLARELAQAFPGIDSHPAVCGGDSCIARTRIPVWVLEQARRQGLSEAEILQSYRSLRAEDLANAWAYVRAHRNEIEGQIDDNEAA
jgi:uncharacterized protein (DUF433 family)